MAAIAGGSVTSVQASSLAAARPVWLEGRQEEMNLFAGFTGAFDASPGQRVSLRITASCLYRAFLNGEFIGYGPARGPHGWFRVDEWDLSPLLAEGQNLLAVEVAGYNVNTFYTLDQPSFLQAEVLVEGDVQIATGRAEDFMGSELGYRLQKVQRYSFQRPFIEVYQMTPQSQDWRQGGLEESEALAVQEAHPLLPRRVPYPRFHLRQPLRDISAGEIETGVAVERLWKDRALVNVGPKFASYGQDELALVVSDDLQKMKFTQTRSTPEDYSSGSSLAISPNQYRILDFGTNLTGFIGAQLTCREPVRVQFVFDEILSGDDVSFNRMGCVNAVTWDLQPGTYSVESFEAYTLRYLKILVMGGACEVKAILMREYANPDVDEAQFAASDVRFNRLFDAARETFRQNAVDVYTDCPSRERAGWLCDSFFIARVDHDLSHNSQMEKAFFENFLLPESFEHIPEGMLPMCYPADHNDGQFIPNWALWFVVQLEEYLQRTGDRELVEALQPRVMKLFDYFKPFRNENGLLEDLAGWVFVEWSDANTYLKGVNYPTNMLYAGALAAAGRMYGSQGLLKDAAGIQEVIRRQSFDGEFFVDNATRRESALARTGNRSEVCQYYAFFFGTATPETHPELWAKLRDEFGPKRRESGAYPHVAKANAFIGNVLRLELLSRAGLVQQLLDESIGYHLYMAERTGTLWEHDSPGASCNHGFAAHLAHVFYRDVLGLQKVDVPNKRIEVRVPDVNLEWCEGRMPVPEGFISMRWWKEDGQVRNRVDAPAGYHVNVVP